MRFTVGSVPYANAKPLIEGLKSNADVKVVFDEPSQLPAMLAAGTADAVLVSSIDAIRSSGKRIVEGCSISSFGAAKSVRLFSKVHPTQITTLALDESSMTSNALAQVVLRERYGVQPKCSLQPPHLQLMLESADAAILIGDRGMTAAAEELRVLDLGEEWFALTHLPFVWALWVGGEGLSSELASALLQSKLWGSERLDEISKQVSVECGWPLIAANDYLCSTMDYNLTDRHLEGLWKFGELLVSNGLIEQCHRPELVRGMAAAPH